MRKCSFLYVTWTVDHRLHCIHVQHLDCHKNNQNSKTQKTISDMRMCLCVYLLWLSFVHVDLTCLSLLPCEASGEAACVSYARMCVSVSVQVRAHRRVSWGLAGDGSTLSGWDSRYCHLYKRHESTPARTGWPTKKQPIIQRPDWHRVDRAEREMETHWT